MSHILCENCGSQDHVVGYGFAGGGLGSYTICLNCDEVLEFSPDPQARRVEDGDETTAREV